MKINDALRKGYSVCVALKDDKREIGCYIVFNEVNQLSNLLNSIVGDVVEVKNNRNYDYIKTLYVSELSWEELEMENCFIKGDA